MTLDIQFVPLSREYDRASFDCGHTSLNDFLKKFSTQYEKRNIGRTFLGVMPDKQIAGYYTLVSSAIDVGELPEAVAKHLGKHPIPVILLGRLAVATYMQGQGVGNQLLRDALQRCVNVANQIGVFAIFVEAIDAKAKVFYEKYGFTPLISNPFRLFLPISSVPK